MHMSLATAISRQNLLLAAECLLEMGAHSPEEHTAGVDVRERLASLMTAPTLPAQAAHPGWPAAGPSWRCAPRSPIAATGAGASWSISFGHQRWLCRRKPAAIGRCAGLLDRHLPGDQPRLCVVPGRTPGAAAPRYWYDLRFNNPACPVVGVTWHDAMSYCAWLRARLSRASLLPPGWVVRLPREVEWEKAASWDAERQSKRRYPWGDEWDATRANTVDGRGPWYTFGSWLLPQRHQRLWPARLYRQCLGVDGRPVYELPRRGAAIPRGRALHAARLVLRLASYPRSLHLSQPQLPPDAWRYHLGFRIVIGQPIGWKRVTR